MNKEEFRELARDMLPLIQQMQEVVKKHGLKELGSVALNANGYFSFSTSEGYKWTFYKLETGDDMYISNYSQDLHEDF